MILCGFLGVEFKIQAHMQIFITTVFYKLKPIQNTTKITEISEILLKLGTLHVIGTMYQNYHHSVLITF